MAHRNDPEVVTRLLTSKGRWAVVGLSNNPARPAVGVSRFVRDSLGMEIIPVNLSGQAFDGQQGFRKLAEIPGQVDVVDCFVNSAKVGDVVDQAIAVGAKAVWLQLGVVDEDAARRAANAGLDVVMNTCPVIEAGRFGL
ncbi:CoA-binding protein [Arthrobacter koreensis]|jgi:predicted CoA-binding protein|uniref:CoA-binding protein n=1 Tax=Arthrobacter TaxID=1663 RepID=UPI002DBD3A3E|nr:CoA-binding protein [Arthrobacter koreensis]MEB7446904.1 CoA-binding protein [Arthrobacter koreensis]